jgi:hypothetical protein
MTPEDREQMRWSLLRFLARRPWAYGLPTSVLHAHVRLEGLPHITRADVEAELQYLEDKGLATCINKAISPELRSWRITAAGRDLLAAHGIEESQT